MARRGSPEDSTRRFDSLEQLPQPEPYLEQTTQPYYTDNADIQAQILYQLQVLVDLQSHSVAARAPIASEWIYNGLLQMIGLAVAALFGAFSILAWQVAGAANSLAVNANGLAADANHLTTQGNCVAKAANLVTTLQFCQADENLSNPACRYLDDRFGIAGDGVASSRGTVLNAVVLAMANDVESCYPSTTSFPSPTSTSTSISPTQTSSASTQRSTSQSITLSSTSNSSSSSSSGSIRSTLQSPTTSAGAQSSSQSNSTSSPGLGGGAAGAIAGAVIGFLVLAGGLVYLRYLAFLSRKGDSRTAMKAKVGTA